MKFSEVLRDNKKEALEETAKNMLKDGVPIEKIIKYTNLELKDVEALSKEVLVKNEN